MTDAWSDDGEAIAFPCPWADGEAILPSGATGLVHDGELHGFVVGCFAARYQACLRKLVELRLPFAELHFKESDGTSSCHGMIWRE